MAITLDGTAGITTPEIISTAGPVVVDASAPDNSLVVAANGNVGVGKSTPGRALDIARAGATIGIENTSVGGGIISVDAPVSGVAQIDVAGLNILRFNTNAAERMRIDDTRVYIGTTDTTPAQSNVGGMNLFASGQLNINVDATFHRIGRSQDGAIVTYYSGGVAQGSHNISGTTFSLVGGHLARWAQFTDNSRPELLKGTVMSNLDQMSTWTNEDNEQLNCIQISNVEGDKNVAGVFVAWDNSDDGYNDILLAMTGDMVIRIAHGITVQRGDLLMSAGDGTAKPQEDDIVRSKTIAKVTSTHVSHTYADGSYAVPCVLMAC